MRTWITTQVKRGMLRLIESRGYALVKQPAQARTRTVGGSEALATAAPSSRSPARIPAALLPPAEFGFRSGAGAAQMQEFLERASTALDGNLPDHARGVFVAISYLARENIPGDLVDAGDGTPANLALVAAALPTLGDTARRLVLFDVTADATHRPETVLPLWGSDWSDLLDERASARAKQVEPPTSLPRELLATGYPPDAISIARIPFEMIDLSRAIAFLGLTAETYEANRAAIKALMPLVSPGGVVAVQGSGALRPSQPGCVQHQVDAVAEYLENSGTPLSFWHPAPDFRLVTPQ